MACTTHQWKEESGRGHTYVCCAVCHQFPPPHLQVLRDLEELHAMAAAHNPKPPSAETRAKLQAKQRQLAADPVRAAQAWENIQRALNMRELMSPEERAKNEALWDAWDDARDPQIKAKAQMRLGESVACWMSHVEALERALHGARKLSGRELDRYIDAALGSSKV